MAMLKICLGNALESHLWTGEGQTDSARFLHSLCSLAHTSQGGNIAGIKWLQRVATQSRAVEMEATAAPWRSVSTGNGEQNSKFRKLGRAESR